MRVAAANTLHLEKIRKHSPTNITNHIQIIWFAYQSLILWFQEKNIPVFLVFGRLQVIGDAFTKGFRGAFSASLSRWKSEQNHQKTTLKAHMKPNNCCLNWVFLTMFQPLRFLMRTLYKFALFDTLTPMCFTFGVVKESSNPAPVIVDSLSSMNSFPILSKNIGCMELYENIPYKLSYYMYIYCILHIS